MIHDPFYSYILCQHEADSGTVSVSVSDAYNIRVGRTKMSNLFCFSFIQFTSKHGKLHLHCLDDKC